jgi:hypothetical protein
MAHDREGEHACMAGQRIDRDACRTSPEEPAAIDARRLGRRDPIARVAVSLMLVGLLINLGGSPAAAAKAGTERVVAGLDAAVNATWTRLPIRDWAARASALAGIPVILDRRIDPERTVTLTAQGDTLRDVIDTVASSLGAAVVELESTVRIVPTGSQKAVAGADRDRGLRVASLPPRARAPLATRRPWAWPAGAEPRDLIREAAAEAGITLAGSERIPHDHFPSAEFPPLSLAERLDLVLAHFDRRVLWEATRGRASGRIVALDAEILPAAARAAPARTPGGEPDGDRPGKRTVILRDEFTLRLEAPLDQALAAICGNLGLTLELDTAGLAARGIPPGEIVRADVDKASREQLLDAVLHPLGLEWKIEGDRLRVFSAPAKTVE